MFEHSLIPPHQSWLVLAALFVIVAFGLWAETTRWGGRLSGTVVIILGAIFLSNMSVIPADAPVYDIVWSYFVPLAIPLLLFKADLRRILRETGPTLLAFIFGAIGSVVGTIVAFYLVPVGKEAWKIAAIFCATYIGGSINYVATSEAVGLKSPDLLAAGVAADMVVMAIFFLILLAIPSIGFLRKRYPVRLSSNSDVSPVAKPVLLDKKVNALTLPKMVNSLAVAAGLCALGYGIADVTHLKGTGILFVTAFTVILATVFPNRMKRLSGADQLGTLFMLVFFAVIGAGANVFVVMRTSPILFVFAAVILCIHLFFILFLGWLFKLDLIEIVVASNANLGGPTTAAAMAVSCKWEGLVIPAILVGTLGYAIATFIAVALGFWLK